MKKKNKQRTEKEHNLSTFISNISTKPEPEPWSWLCSFHFIFFFRSFSLYNSMYVSLPHLGLILNAMLLIFFFFISISYSFSCSFFKFQLLLGIDGNRMHTFSVWLRSLGTNVYEREREPMHIRIRIRSRMHAFKKVPANIMYKCNE